MIDYKVLAENKEFAYLLGLIWADGYLNKQRVELYGATEDLQSLEPIIQKFLTKKYVRQRKHWKPSVMYYENSVKLVEFLKALEFDKKSFVEPVRVLDFICLANHYLFWRGFFDGDGSVHMSKNRTNRQLNFSGAFEYKWETLSQILDSFGISYSIYRNVSKLGHKASMIRFCGRENIRRFGIALYPFGSDGIGFARKYRRLGEVLE